MITTGIITTIIVLSILILVHEFGHFLLAKAFSVGVETFSLGFGPRILSRKIGQTTYKICMIPLGGYVKMIGESPREVPEEEEETSFSHKSLPKRAAIVAAGPLFNLLFALVVFLLIFSLWGVPQLTSEVGDVREGSPAEKGGILKGDEIIAIDGQKTSKWADISEMVRDSEGRELLIDVKRDGEVLTFKVKPEISTVTDIFGENLKMPLIGIMGSNKYIKESVNPLRALYLSAEQSYNIIRILILGIIKLIQRAIPAKSLGGPILIAQMTSQQAREGIIPLFFFTGALSINLGIINLLPIPILDGGHLFFFFIELTLGRPVSIKKREVAQQIGLIVLILLMALVFYNDLARIIFSQ